MQIQVIGLPQPQTLEHDRRTGALDHHPEGDDPGLVEAAGWQVHAHLLKLKADGKVTGTSVKSAWKLA